MTVQPGGLLNPAGPAQNELLIHFCGRPGAPSPGLPDEFRFLVPADRLSSILWQQCLWGFPPFGASSPMVSMSESPLDHLQWLLSVRGLSPWGMLLYGQQVYEAGGGPVWYARSAQYAGLNDDQRRWAVRLDADPLSRSDWLHEREWRVPVPDSSPHWPLTPAVVYGVLVGDPSWAPMPRATQQFTGRWIDPLTGGQVDASSPNAYPQTVTVLNLPTLWSGLRRWYWNPAEAKLYDVTPAT